MIEEKFVFRQEGLQPIGGLLQEITQDVKKLKDEQEKTFAESTSFVKKYDKALEDTCNELEEVSKCTKDVDKENKSLRQTLKDLAKEQTIFGVSIGGTINNLKEKQKQLRAVTTGLGGGSKALKVFRAALLATGIGVVLIALGGLVAMFQRFQPAIDLAGQALSGLSAAMNVVIDRAIKFTQAIGSILSGDFEEGFDGIKESVSGVGDELLKEAKAAFELEKRSNSLKDSQRELSVQFAKTRAEIEKLRIEADRESNTFKVREEAIKRAIVLEEQLEGKRAELAKEALDIQQKRNALGNNTRADLEKEAELEIALFEVVEDANSKRAADILTLQSLEKEQAEQRKQRYEERKKQIEEIEKALESQTKALESQLNAAITSNLQGKELAEEQRRQALAQLEVTQELALAEIERLSRIDKTRADALALELEQSDVFNKLREQIELRHQQELSKIESDEAVKREAERKEREQKRLEELQADRERVQQFIDESNAEFEEQKQLELLRIELIEESTNKTLSLESLKRQKQLEIEREFLQKKLAFGLISQSIDQQEAESLGLQIQLIEKQLSEISTIDLTPFDEFKNNLLSKLGINEEEGQLLLNSLSTITDSVFQALSAGVDAQLTAIEKRINDSQEKVDDLREKVEEEQKLQEEGSDNNLATLQAQLAREEEMLRQSEEKKAALQEKAAKLRRSQLAIETAATVANSIVNIFNQSSKLPLGIGIALGIAQVALMLASIAKFKSEAASLTKFEDGGLIKEGHLHKDGGSIIEAEKGEFVVNRKTVSKKGNLQFLEDFNAGKIDITAPTIKPLVMPEFPKLDFIGGAAMRLENAKAELEVLERQDKQRNLENALRAVLPQLNSKLSNEIVSAIEGKKDTVFLPKGQQGKIIEKYKEGNNKITNIITVEG